MKPQSLFEAIVIIVLGAVLVLGFYYAGNVDGKRQGRIDGAKESLCALKDGRYKTYLREIWPQPVDPLEQVVRDCPNCRKGPQR